MYVELAERSVNNRGKIIPISEVGTQKADYERYCSLYPFDSKIIEYVNLNKSITGFVGLHYCPAIYFDVDSNNLDLAKSETLKLIIKLNKEFNISPNELQIYFSGGKGFHIGLNYRLYGGIEPNENIADKIKRFAEKFTIGFTCVDLKIYENHRLFRLPNSLNTKRNCYKIEISFSELEKLSVDEILELSKDVRTDFKRLIPISTLTLKKELKSYLDNIKPEIVINNVEYNEPGFFKPASEGERNEKLHKQAILLFSKSELNRDAIFDILTNANIASGNPIPLNELKTLLSSAEKYTKNNKKVRENLELKSFGEWTNEWVDSLREEENKITLGFEPFDDEMKGKLRGKLGVIIGYGGSKKSLYSAFIEYCNITKKNYRCIYSTMEMGIASTMDRFIDFAVETKNYNASYEIGLYEKSEPGIASKLMTNDIVPIYSDKLLITQNSSMLSDDYDLMIQKKIDEVGKIDILVVDGLSMMGGKDKETENYSKNSKELKELAKKYNILVLLIAHVSRGAKRYYKDLSGLVRGSEKIIDNCDFHITMSQVIDESKSTPHEEVFIDDFGYATLVNKRGSGKTISVGFKLKPNRLWFEESSEILAILEKQNNNKPEF